MTMRMLAIFACSSDSTGPQRVVGAFAIGHAPSSNGLLNEPMYAGLQKVRGGASHTRHDPVLFTGAPATPTTPY